jgi:hypothetical protein
MTAIIFPIKDNNRWNKIHTKTTIFAKIILRLLGWKLEASYSWGSQNINIVFFKTKNNNFVSIIYVDEGTLYQGTIDWVQKSFNVEKWQISRKINKYAIFTIDQKHITEPKIGY